MRSFCLRVRVCLYIEITKCLKLWFHNNNNTMYNNYKDNRIDYTYITSILFKFFFISF